MVSWLVVVVSNTSSRWTWKDFDFLRGAVPLNTNTLSSIGFPKQTFFVGMHRKKQELADLLVTFFLEAHGTSLAQPWLGQLHLWISAQRSHYRLEIDSKACSPRSCLQCWESQKNLKKVSEFLLVEPEEGMVKSPLPVSSKTTLGVASLHAWQRTKNNFSTALLAIFHEVEQIFR